MNIANTHHHADCFTVFPTLADASIDMILTDLPYARKSRHAWDTPLDLDKLWDAWLRITKENAAIVLTAQQPFTTHLIKSAEKFFRYSLVWEKKTPTGFLNAKCMPLRTHEDILVFYRKLPTYNPQMTQGHERKTVCQRKTTSKQWGAAEKRQDYSSTERYPTSILRFALDNRFKGIHPTQKPVGLFEWLIKTYSNEGDTILDCCSGSGTTAIAALNTKRKYVCIEQDKQLFEAAQERIEQHIANG